MKTTFTVRRNNGQEFNVVFRPIPVRGSSKKTEADSEEWADIEVDGKHYGVIASRARINGQVFHTIKIGSFGKDLLDALEVPASMRKTDVHILATENWETIYNEMLEESKREFTKVANSAVFSKIGLHHHSYYGWSVSSWDCDLDTAYMEYNSTILALTNALTYIKTNMMDQYLTGSDYDDYNSMSDYELPISDIDSIINMSAPVLAEAAAKKEKAEKKAEADRVRAENIKKGSIYFHCESAPHDEDLSQVVLNRPAPNKGLFTITHRIEQSLFSRIKKFGSYWSEEWLEECDMFYSSPGWRFSSDAIAELAKDRDVYVDDQKVEL